MTDLFIFPYCCKFRYFCQGKIFNQSLAVCSSVNFLIMTQYQVAIFGSS